MSIPITAILAALGQSGLGDIVAKTLDKSNDTDKLKLKFIATIVEKMDETGSVSAKELIAELVEKGRLFDFDD